MQKVKIALVAFVFRFKLNENSITRDFCLTW